MPLLRKDRFLREPIERVCRRKVRRGKLTEKQAAAVKAALKSEEAMKLLTARVAGLPMPVMGEGERPIIDWLMANWETIFKFIMAIVAALGLL